MAEYTMKIELDNSSLARFEALVKRLEKVTLGGGTTGGGGGSAQTTAGGTAGRDAPTKKSAQDLQNKMFKLQKDTRLGKFGPGLVKLAGFAIGLSGLLQFRKMLIDSSPMLQAMLAS